MPGLEVNLAGAVTMAVGDEQLGASAFGGRQLRLVTALLVLERDAPILVERLADELWPAELPTRWRPAVRVLVSKLRRRLTDLGLESDTISSVGGAYQVRLGPVRVDVEDALAQAASARTALGDGRIDEARALANRARAVLSRPILPGVDSTWLEGVREQCHHRLVDALVVLGECRSRLGRHADARTVVAEAIDRAPLDEAAWRASMRLELRAGSAGAALAAYDQLRAALADALGVDPSAATQHLHGEVLQAIPDPGSEPPTHARPPDPAAAPTSHTSPYVGLRPFRRGDEALFFGRTVEVQELVARLARQRLVTVIGPSGVGKSSLVLAGLLPALRRGAIPDSDTWVPIVVMPGSTPVKSLATELAAASDHLDGTDAAAILARDPDGLHDIADAMLSAHDPAAKVLVVVDQLEEVFTLATRDEATQLVALLTAAVRRLDARVTVVATLRGDFFDAASRVPGMADLLSRTQYVVPPLAGEQVEEAVVGPARQAHLELEPGLLALILTDMAGEPGALPLLAHLLRALWERRVGAAMTRGAYDDLGGVAGALAQRAESVYADLDQDDRGHVRRLLLRAVHPGDDGADARRPVHEVEWVGPDDDRATVDDVVGRLVDARLLTASRDPGDDGRVIELAHEALIDGWPRLRAWVDQARGWLLDHRRLTVAAREWERHDRHDDWLLAGLPLDEAHELLLADRRGDVDLHLSPLEHDLVAASLAARDEARAEEAARQARQQQLERRSLRRAQALVVVGAVVALVAGTLWWTGRNEARVARATSLVASSGEVLPNDPQLAMLLGLAAHDEVGSGDDPVHHDIASVLHRAIAANRMVARTNEILPMKVAPDGSVMSVRRPEPEPNGTWTIEVLDATTSELLAELPGHGGGAPMDAAFSWDGERVAVEAGDGHTTVWEWRTGRSWLIEDANEQPGGWAALSSDGTYAFRKNVNRPPDEPDPTPAEVWYVGTGTLAEAFEPPATEVEENSWSAYGHFHPTLPHIAVTWADDNLVEVYDVPTAELVWSAEVAGVAWAQWSPDGRWMAVAGDRFVLLDAATGEQVSDIDRTGVPSPIRWSLDSRQVSIGVSPRNPEPSRIWTVVDDDGPIPAPDAPLVLRGGTFPCAMAVFGPGTTVWEASACGSGHRSWDLDPAVTAERGLFPSDDRPSQPLAFSPDGEWLAAAAPAGGVVIHDAETLGPVRELATDAATDLSWDADGRVLATIDQQEVVLWDAESGDPVLRRDVPGDGRVAVSPDGELIAWSSVSRTRGAATDGIPLDEGPTDDLVWIMDRAGNEVAAHGWGDGLEVMGLDFSADGSVLAITANVDTLLDSPDNGTVLWEWRTDSVVGLVRTGQEAAIGSFDPSGQRLYVTAGPPLSRVEAWDAASALAANDAPDDPTETVASAVTFEGHDQHVRDLALSADGARMATCGRDGTARLWDATSGRQLQVLVADDIVDWCSIDISPDGSTVAVTDPATGTWVFATDVEDVAAIARDRVVRSFTPEECQEYFDGDTCPI